MTGIPPELPQEAGYWYRRWLHAQECLDQEIAERISHFVRFDQQLTEAAIAGRVSAILERRSRDVLWRRWLRRLTGFN